MYSIFSVIPDPEKILELEPEELAGYVMEYLNGLPDNERWKIHPGNQFGLRTSNPRDWPSEYHDRIDEYRYKIPRALDLAT